ncbi:ROK family protein [Alicyclobacillus fastidiosus]|uniref:ROK family protein n=1 Tax=Alicyclobacillus fastidiosus TaxID=392011 RepID=A0ABY6ZJE9_9BACL|nr:ROK family protein [Alicyclobacillus fastidiosus]WAH43048.1 ROK family protein [Alicyclobacillus fastidiosus]GMA65032.1 N-acylmannosamine kinase [Alicyclobacillus fastidiosus]
MYSIGVDLGGTKILTGLVDESGVIYKTVECPTAAQQGPDAVIDQLIRSIDEVAGSVERKEICGIGIGAPGPLNPVTGVVLSPPNLPGWDNIPLRQIIEAKCGLPTFLENDANVAALAEHRFGAGRGVEDMVYITVSTGVGAGLILNGRLYGGAGGYAGEVGHTVVDTNGRLCDCGNRGCLEAVASGTAIARKAEQVFQRPMSAKDVAIMAENGSLEAKAILDEAMHYLGMGIVSIVNVFNSSRIVIGGGVSRIGDAMFEPLRHAVRELAFPAPAAMVEIMPAELGLNSGLLGGAALPLAQLAELKKTKSLI